MEETIIIRYAGWISGRIVSFKPDPDIQKLLSNGNRYTDPDIRNAFIVVSRIQSFGKSCTLHNDLFIIFRSIFSAFCAITPSLSISDVVETVTSETETWLKFLDETETETLS